MISSFKCSLRKWDSNFFNRKIYDLSCQLEEFTKDHTALHSEELITEKVDSQDEDKIRALNDFGFLFCEGELLFEKRISESKIVVSEIYLANVNDIDELLEMVPGLYSYSRFKSPWFTEVERDEFYKKWLENAVNASFDDFCLIQKDDFGKIVGFITLKIECGCAIIGLMGVNKHFQGQGIGKKLIENVELLAIKKKINKLKVATQMSNINAVNFYQRKNFNISKLSYWFYK